jgi:hypothetical protein
MTNPTNHIALEALDEFGSKFPGIWGHIDTLRALASSAMDLLPTWCFLPRGASQYLVQAMRQETALSFEGLADSKWLSALAAWRLTKGIYAFDPDVFDAVVNSPVTGIIPFEVLCRLPEWCIYVETCNLSFQGQLIEGMWAHLEWDEQLQLPSLHITALSSTDVNHIGIGLKDWTLNEALGSCMHFERNGISNQLNTDHLCEEVAPFVSLLLYVCSQTSEIGDGWTSPKNPEPKVVRKVPRLFQAKRLTLWNVGIRMGAKLRISGVTTRTNGGGSHGSPRPHIRRAHWQGFRSGPRKDQQGFLIPVSARDLYVKWLPPMLINEPAAGVQMLPATVRAVI